MGHDFIDVRLYRVRTYPAGQGAGRLRFKHDLAARVTLLELSIGFANIRQGKYLSDRDFKPARGE